MNTKKMESIRTYKKRKRPSDPDKLYKIIINMNMCRLCLGTKNLSNMFCIEEQIDKFVEVLALTTGLQIHPNDGLPQHICTECGSLVNEAYRLRKQSQNSHLRLQKIFKTIRIEDATDDKVEMFSAMKMEDNNDYVEEIEIAAAEDIKNANKTNEDSDNTMNRNTTALKDGIGKDNSKKAKEETSKTRYKIEKKIHKRTKKETRELYLSYVDGDFNPEAPVLGPIRCKQCRNVAVNKWPCFISHVRQKHGLATKVVCESCGKTFFGKHNLDRHRRSYHGLEKTFACKYCDHKAISKIRLENHERRIHTGDRPHICDKCDAAYFSRRCLLQHLETHLPSAEIQCDLCPAKLRSRAHLSRHKYEIHSGKRLVKRREQRQRAAAKLHRLDAVPVTTPPFSFIDSLSQRNVTTIKYYI